MENLMTAPTRGTNFYICPKYVLSSQQDGHMGKGGAVVLEQLVPEGGPLCAVVEQTPADVDERTEELLPVPR